VKKHMVRIALSSALAAGLTLSAGFATFGDPRSDCEKRLDGDRARIDHDIARHGDHSPQVNRDIARMDDDRSWCRSHNADWDHDRFDVGIYIKH